MLPSFVPVVLFWRCQSDYLAQNNVSIKRDSRWWKFTKCSLFAWENWSLLALAKNKRTARILANARKYHLIPLLVGPRASSSRVWTITLSQSFWTKNVNTPAPWGDRCVNNCSLAPDTGKTSMSIAPVCPPSPRWGKTLIGALSANKKRLFFVHRKIFQLVDPV